MRCIGSIALSAAQKPPQISISQPMRFFQEPLPSLHLGPSIFATNPKYLQPAQMNDFNEPVKAVNGAYSL